jgi:hypothetical protein
MPPISATLDPIVDSGFEGYLKSDFMSSVSKRDREGKITWLSVRVCPRPDGDDRPYVVIAGQSYVVSTKDGPIVPAPADY